MDPCERWRGVAPHGLPAVPERVASCVRHGATAADFLAARERILRYDIYPSRIVASQVCAPDGRVREGCVIAQWLRLGPFRYACAVRVEALHDEDAAGRRTVRMAYRTLAGHPERGRIAFSLAWEQAAGTLEASVTYASVPALWWSRLGKPFAERLQGRMNAGAARRLAGKEGP